MTEHLCQFVVRVHESHKPENVCAIRPFDEELCCGRLAHFNIPETFVEAYDYWFCAEHYDAWIAATANL